jgi:CheY-like chemotaxis protein
MDTFDELERPIELTRVKNGKLLLDYISGLDTPNTAATPDLIMLDINMPLINGIETLERLRSQLTTKDIPVLMISTSQNKDDIEKSYELGANAYLSKPFDYTELRATLNRILSETEFTERTSHENPDY